MERKRGREEENPAKPLALEPKRLREEEKSGEDGDLSERYFLFPPDSPGFFCVNNVDWLFPNVGNFGILSGDGMLRFTVDTVMVRPDTRILQAPPFDHVLTNWLSTSDQEGRHCEVYRALKTKRPNYDTREIILGIVKTYFNDYPTESDCHGDLGNTDLFFIKRDEVNDLTRSHTFIVYLLPSTRIPKPKPNQANAKQRDIQALHSLIFGRILHQDIRQYPKDIQHFAEKLRVCYDIGRTDEDKAFDKKTIMGHPALWFWNDRYLFMERVWKKYRPLKFQSRFIKLMQQPSHVPPQISSPFQPRGGPLLTQIQSQAPHVASMQGQPSSSSNHPVAPPGGMAPHHQIALPQPQHHHSHMAHQQLQHQQMATQHSQGQHFQRASQHSVHQPLGLHAAQIPPPPPLVQQPGGPVQPQTRLPARTGNQVVLTEMERMINFCNPLEGHKVSRKMTWGKWIRQESRNTPLHKCLRSKASTYNEKSRVAGCKFIRNAAGHMTDWDSNTGDPSFIDLPAERDWAKSQFYEHNISVLFPLLLVLLYEVFSRFGYNI